MRARSKSTTPHSVQNGHRTAIFGRLSILFRHRQHLGTVRQQSEHQQKPEFRIADDPVRQEAPKEAENEDRNSTSLR